MPSAASSTLIMELILGNSNDMPMQLEAQRKAISIRRSLAIRDPVTHTPYLARALENLGMSLDDLNNYSDAAAVYKEAVQHCRNASALDSLRYNAQLAKILYNYGITLRKSNQFSEAAKVDEEAVSCYRNLAQKEARYKEDLIDALANYGHSCYALGHHAEAVLVYQEYISLQCSLATKEAEQEEDLYTALHNMASSFHALGQDAKAEAAATEALQLNQGSVIKACKYAPDSGSCFVCQKANNPDPLTPRSDTTTPLLIPLHSSSSPPAEPRGYSEFTSLIPTDFIPSTSVHSGPTNAPYLLRFGQSGVVPNPSPQLSSPSPSISRLPSNHPLTQELVNSGVHLPKSSEGTQKVLWRGIKAKLVGVFRGNRAERDMGL